MLCEIGAWAGFSAKTLAYEGYTPMMVYLPLVVHGTPPGEPTKSENRPPLNWFIAALAGFAERERADNAEFFHETPHHTPRGFLVEAAK